MIKTGKGYPSTMRVVNKLTQPGNIRRVDIMPATVRIQTSDGQDRLYRLVSSADVPELDSMEPDSIGK